MSNQLKTLISILAATAACSSSNNKQTDAPKSHEDAKPIDSTVKPDAPLDAPAGTEFLTVLNYDAWCSVTIASNPASANASQTAAVPPGNVTLKATALSGFQLGDWYGTTGDTGNGDPGTVTGTGSAAVSTTTATVGSTAKCVSVCCPFTGGAGCPGTNQCP